MKNKILKKFLCLALALIMLLPFSSCGKKEENLMELEGVSMPMDVYKLMLSVQKGNMAYLINYYYGDYNSPEFWDTVIKEPSTTNDQYYTYAVYQKAKNLLSAARLFDEMKLKLPESTVNSIDNAMNELVEEFGGGKKDALNTVIATYGFDYDTIREYKILEAKASYVSNELYGSDASKISAGIKQDYLEDNYVAFKQILIANFYYVFNTDENGDIIYYDGLGKVAYDTVNGVAKTDDDGNVVYYTADGKIAYDTKSGKPSPVLGDDGYQTTEDYVGDELLERAKLAAELAEIGEESQSVFDSLCLDYSDDQASASKEIYVATNVNYQSISAGYEFMDNVAAELSDMKVGEVRVMQDELGFHVIRRYPISEGAYANKDLAGWFKDTNYGVYDFNSNLKNDLFTSVLSEYHEKITVDEELLNSATLRDAVPNYYYH